MLWPVPINPVAWDSPDPPSMTGVYAKNDYLKVRWNFNAKNESRTFILKYKIHNVVKRYNDVSVIYHKFIG